MRLLYDLFPCQTGSRLRGIGRFTLALAQAMADTRGAHQVIGLANGTGVYRDSCRRLRQVLGGAPQSAPLLSYTYADPAYVAGDSMLHEALADIVINRACDDLVPDVVLHATPFEGWGEVGVGALPLVQAGPALRVAVLYDFIPWLFPQQYLDGVPGYRQWYVRRMAALQRFDLLLAISDATRDDAIRLLGIAPEKVVNISGAASPMFRPGSGAAQDHGEAGSVLQRFGIRRRFVLYTGNVDFRKNQAGMLRAYAALAPAMRREHQLVLTQVLEPEKFLAEVRTFGLNPEEVIVTGHVSDTEMIALYTGCTLFVFPSLYEGFGLPILEAMACGAAVLAADNSSMPEVVGRSDMLFNAADPAAIARAMQRVLGDEALRQELKAYGIARAAQFSWPRSAALAWEAIEAAALARRMRGKRLAAAQLQRRRLAVVCVSPTVDCAATRHLLGLLPRLAAEFDIELYVEEGVWADAPDIEARFPIYPHTRLAAQRSRYAALLYQFDDTREHAFMLPLAEQLPGIVVLHSWCLQRAVGAHAVRIGRPELITRELLYCHGLQGLLVHAALLPQHAPATAEATVRTASHGISPNGLPLRFRGSGDAVPLNRHLLESAGFVLLAGGSHEAGTVALENPHGGWQPPFLRLDDDSQHALATYRRAIDAAPADRQAQTVAAMADALQGTVPSAALLEALASHVINNRRLQQQPRLLLDVTQLARSDTRSGIQRVVRSIARALGRLADLRRPLEIVAQADGRLWRATQVVASLFDIDARVIPAAEILAQPGDILLMIDSSWEQYGDFVPVFADIHRLGGQVVTVVYDLIPLQRPETCIPALVVAFQAWFRLAARHSDVLLCISKAVAGEVRQYLAHHGLDPEGRLAICSWPLGADISVAHGEHGVRPEVVALSAQAASHAAMQKYAAAASAGSQLFLMVGTIEPRKGHDFVLDAFELLWARGVDVRLCIAGGIGWKTEDTVSRIRHHPQLHRKLFFIQSFTDAEITLCYGAATALIAASVAEGFGLPIVEAALHRIPALASDIPVFREVGGDGARYFSLASPRCLADTVTEFGNLNREQRLDMAQKITTLSWEQSAQQLLAAIGAA